MVGSSSPPDVYATAAVLPPVLLLVVFAVGVRVSAAAAAAAGAAAGATAVGAAAAAAAAPAGAAVGGAAAAVGDGARCWCHCFWCWHAVSSTAADDGVFLMGLLLLVIVFAVGGPAGGVCGFYVVGDVECDRIGHLVRC